MLTTNKCKQRQETYNVTGQDFTRVQNQKRSYYSQNTMLLLTISTTLQCYFLVVQKSGLCEYRLLETTFALATSAIWCPPELYSNKIQDNQKQVNSLSLSLSFIKDVAFSYLVWQDKSGLCDNSRLVRWIKFMRANGITVLVGTYPLYPLTIFRILSFMSSNGMDSTLGFAGPLCSGAEALKSSITFSNLKRK